MVVGGISSEPSRAVNAHAVQHNDAAIEYQNQLLLRVLAAAPMTVPKLLGTTVAVNSALMISDGCPLGAGLKGCSVGLVTSSGSQTAERAEAAAAAAPPVREWLEPDGLAGSRFSPDEAAPSTMIILGCYTFRSADNPQ
jgi:hypothetical protein